jgi:hypothetical protein
MRGVGIGSVWAHRGGRVWGLSLGVEGSGVALWVRQLCIGVDVGAFSPLARGGIGASAHPSLCSKGGEGMERWLARNLYKIKFE